MPTFPEDMLRGVVSLLDQGMDITVLRHALGVGVLGKLPEAQTEGLVRLVGEPLAPQVDHFVTEQCVPDLPKLRIGHFRSLYATDLRPMAAESGRTSMNLYGAAWLSNLPVGCSRMQLPYRSIAL